MLQYNGNNEQSFANTMLKCDLERIKSNLPVYSGVASFLRVGDTRASETDSIEQYFFSAYFPYLLLRGEEGLTRAYALAARPSFGKKGAFLQ